MKVTKHGKVVFKDRQIVEIEGFTVEGGTLMDLRSYVESAYRFDDSNLPMEFYHEEVEAALRDDS